MDLTSFLKVAKKKCIPFCRNVLQCLAELGFPTFREIFSFHISTAVKSAKFREFYRIDRIFHRYFPNFSTQFSTTQGKTSYKPVTIRRVLHRVLVPDPRKLCNVCHKFERIRKKTTVFVFHKLLKVLWKTREKCGNSVSLILLKDQNFLCYVLHHRQP